MAKQKLLITAIIFGAFAVLLVFMFADQQQKELEQVTRDQVRIVKARQELPVGTTLTEKLVTIESVPRRFLPVNVVEEKDLSLYLSTPLAVKAPEGAMLLSSDFVKQESARTLSSKIPKDERAMTIPVDTISGVSGLLKPGDRIDILGTFPVSDDSELVEDMNGRKSVGYVTMPLLQNVTLLATGQVTSDLVEDKGRRQRGYDGITLSVTVEEAELLTIAQTRGKLMTLLRSREDVDIIPVSKRTLKDVLQDLEVLQTRRVERTKRKPAPVRAKKKKPGIIIDRGTSR